MHVKHPCAGLFVLAQVPKPQPRDLLKPHAREEGYEREPECGLPSASYRPMPMGEYRGPEDGSKVGRLKYLPPVIGRLIDSDLHVLAEGVHEAGHGIKEAFPLSIRDDGGEHGQALID